MYISHIIHETLQAVPTFYIGMLYTLLPYQIAGASFKLASNDGVLVL